MDLGLAGTTALVTDGSRGIGFAAAVSLAAEGCNLHLAARHAADLEKAKATIQSAHKVQVTCHVRDLSKHDECIALAKACGDIDILVNNAGLMAFTRALGAEAPDNGVRVVGVNPGKTATERQVNLAKDAAHEKFGDEKRFRS